MLFIVSGHSGCGKTVIMRKTGLPEVVSLTTREMREKEVNGIDYYFVSKNEFDSYLENDELAEYITYPTGDSYGVTSEEIYHRLAKGGGYAYIIAEHNGMKQLKKLFPDAVTIFIYTSKNESAYNMLRRGDSQENIDKRLKLYESVMSTRNDYDYVINNKIGRLDNTVNIVNEIIESYKITKPMNTEIWQAVTNTDGYVQDLML